MCSWLHNGGPTGALDKLIHGVISTPRKDNKASTLEQTLRGEMIIWASTADEAGRDALAKYFSTRPLYYSGLNTAFGLTVNPKGKLERRAFTMETSADDITHWFADHGLTVGEGDEMLAWAKTYLERRWIMPSAPGHQNIPDVIRENYARIKEIKIQDMFQMDKKWMRRETGSAQNNTGASHANDDVAMAE